MSSKISPLKNGPLRLETEQQILSKDGAPVPIKQTAMLCTCGQSDKKPFCDGTHVVEDFSSACEIDAEILQEYPGREVTVYFNRSICSGAANCVEGLPTVFKSGDGAHWIYPDNDSLQKIVERVKGCPSGALAYRLADEVITDERSQPKIDIVKNGPYNVEGVELDLETAPTHGSSSKFALCRCGFSKNKPFCDYSHAENEWRDGDGPADSGSES